MTSEGSEVCTGNRLMVKGMVNNTHIMQIWTRSRVKNITYIIYADVVTSNQVGLK